MPLAAAIALGALLAPPDAVAALAVLRHVSPPKKLSIILEGESLLNDASSLLIYKLAVASVVTGSFSPVGALPSFLLLSVGSIAVGWALARLMVIVIGTIQDAPAATIIQFLCAFGVWIIAERFGLSGVVTIVAFGLTAARRQTLSSRSHIRVFSNSTWKAATFVLNVLAFLLIGLQLRPIFLALPAFEKWHLAGIALVLLTVVILVRLAWVLIYGLARSQVDPERGKKEDLRKGRLLVGWSGMRGIVTLAAALALPTEFPYREFILLTSFVVVLGTLVVQGLTLGPLLRWLKLPEDRSASDELATARSAALEAALKEVEQDESAAAARLRLECQEALAKAHKGLDPHDSSDNALRQRVVPVSRRALDQLRDTGVIGDEAYRIVEQELDLLELSSRPAK
jgi:CPA1 family monovalent cation:H+ antiporter